MTTIDLRRVDAELRLLERQAGAARNEAVDAARAAELSRDQCRAALKNMQGVEREAAAARAADLDKFRSEMRERSQKLDRLIRDIHDEQAAFERRLETGVDASQRQLGADLADEKRARERADDRIERRVDETRDALLGEIGVLRDRVEEHREAISAAGRRARGHLKLYADGALVGEAQNLDFVGAAVTQSGDRRVVSFDGAYVGRAGGTSAAVAALPFINVKDYGAVGNGVADDASAIQAALDVAQDSGGTVMFPAGKYLIGTGLVCNEPARLQGDGGMFWHETNGTEWGGGAVLVADTPGMTVLTLGSNATIRLAGCVVDGLHIIDPSVAAAGGSTVLLDIVDMDNTTVRNCFFYGGIVKNRAVAGDSSWVLFDQNVFDLTRLELGGGAASTVVRAGSFITGNGNGIYVTSAGFLRVMGVKFDQGSNSIGIRLGRGSLGALVGVMFELNGTAQAVKAGEFGPITGLSVNGGGIWSRDWDSPGGTPAGKGIWIIGQSTNRGLGVKIDTTFRGLAEGVRLGQYSDQGRVSGFFEECTAGVVVESGATKHRLVNIESNATLAATIQDSGTDTIKQGIRCSDASVGDLASTFLFARKTADEAVTSSTTLQNDDHLVLALAANSVYEFEAVLFYDGTTTGDLKIAFDVPTGATVQWGETGLAPGAGANPGSATFATVAADATAGGALGGIGAGTRLMVRAAGLVVVDSTAGNLQLQWAQSASDGTATNVFTNSYMTARKVA